MKIRNGWRTVDVSGLGKRKQINLGKEFKLLGCRKPLEQLVLNFFLNFASWSSLWISLKQETILMYF